MGCGNLLLYTFPLLQCFGIVATGASTGAGAGRLLARERRAGRFGGSFRVLVPLKLAKERPLVCYVDLGNQSSICLVLAPLLDGADLDD
jgi:hypothetical protein